MTDMIFIIFISSKRFFFQKPSLDNTLSKSVKNRFKPNQLKTAKQEFKME